MEAKVEPGETVLWISVRFCYNSPKEDYFMTIFYLNSNVKKDQGPRKVYWETPLEGWFKRNIDKSCRDNSGSYGGGRIVQDSNGNFKAAFFRKIQCWNQ